MLPGSLLPHFLEEKLGTRLIMGSTYGACIILTVSSCSTLHVSYFMMTLVTVNNLVGWPSSKLCNLDYAKFWELHALCKPLTNIYIVLWKPAWWMRNIELKLIRSWELFSWKSACVCHLSLYPNSLSAHGSKSCMKPLWHFKVKLQWVARCCEYRQL